MLDILPKIGQFVKVLEDTSWSDTGERFQTKGDIHEIIGISNESGSAYFIGDRGYEVYIDEPAFEWYELVDEKTLFPIEELNSLRNDIRMK